MLDKRLAVSHPVDLVDTCNIVKHKEDKYIHYHRSRRYSVCYLVTSVMAQIIRTCTIIGADVQTCMTILNY